MLTLALLFTSRTHTGGRAVRYSNLGFLRESATNPGGIASEIEHSVDLDDLYLDQIVNPEWESLR